MKKPGFIKVNFEYQLTFIYLILGILWIVFSDSITNAIFLNVDNEILIKVQTYKGIFYVFVTAVLLFSLVRNHLNKLKTTEKELKASEEKYRALVENSLIGVALSKNNKLIFANDYLTMILGYETAGELVNTSIERLIADESKELFTDRIKKRALDMEIPDNYEYKMITKDGRIRDMEFSSHVLIINNERTVQSVIRDITDKKRAEEELFKAKNKAEESDKLKTAFLQNMSHEIRTPLNGILGFSSLLDDDNISTEEIRKYTLVIKQSGDRLLEIVNNVLDISRIETGQVNIVKKPLLINNVLSDLLAFFSPIANSKNIVLNCNFHDNPMIKIHSDETKINQVLTNLINNAIKFTSNGSINYGFEITDNFIQFYVKDTGIGIPREYFEKIFGRFTQVDQQFTQGYEGAGLGLAICKGLVELLGGKIWLESEQNKGTTFFFTIPFEISQNNEIKSQYQDKQVNLNEIKILIAEDDYNSYQYLNQLLSNTQVSVFHAENGLQAVNLIKANPDINLILMDIKMPLMNGIEATKLIKGINPDITIIAQTAYAFSSEKDEILAAGCSDYISKPIPRGKLLALIDKYI